VPAGLLQIEDVRLEQRLLRLLLFLDDILRALGTHTGQPIRNLTLVLRRLPRFCPRCLGGRCLLG